MRRGAGRRRGEGQDVRYEALGALQSHDKFCNAYHVPVMPVMPPVVVKAGESFVEPPNVKMTGYNKSASDSLRVLIFYVSDPDTPFVDAAH